MHFSLSAEGISIHAPYKRVRRKCLLTKSWTTSYFNPRTLQESATVKYHNIGDYEKYFNPRTLQESATAWTTWGKSAWNISIHAPYKRVRLRHSVPKLGLIYFNPRTLQESATFWATGLLIPLTLFQSTHPTRECDAICLFIAKTDFYFNPRTLQESATSKLSCRLSKWLQFQSTHPTRECDKLLSHVTWQTNIFQSTHPTRECDNPWKQPCRHGLRISIHAPYKRVRQYYALYLRGKVTISIHAPYKRVRQAWTYRTAMTIYFNPRTLQESATTTI